MVVDGGGGGGDTADGGKYVNVAVAILMAHAVCHFSAAVCLIRLASGPEEHTQKFPEARKRSSDVLIQKKPQ